MELQWFTLLRCLLSLKASFAHSTALVISVGWARRARRPVNPHVMASAPIVVCVEIKTKVSQYLTLKLRRHASVQTSKSTILTSSENRDLASSRTRGDIRHKSALLVRQAQINVRWKSIIAKRC
ncbi:hypothetical protein FPV67DRAFT_1496938 [Lyophyllum atratum]|nr:hypothetical protein FPV67DRAFT_1496938 [Lyophyllum atratum]